MASQLQLAACSSFLAAATTTLSSSSSSTICRGTSSPLLSCKVGTTQALSSGRGSHLVGHDTSLAAAATVGRRAASVAPGLRVKAQAGEPNGASGSPTEAKFFKVEAVLRPWRLKFVCRELLSRGIRGVTVSDVKGFGAQGGSRERQAGSEFADDNLVVKTKVEVVVIADQVEAVIEAIIQEARTGEIGDGKIFVSPVSEIIRVRTGERGAEAERMAGGREELLSGRGNFATLDGKENN